ncbi:uncharacterized protein LOC118754219 [Rhagoletis pomonella]|uniref:uncharacterized protein LOC118754219 n=1 Tax=Rhagoletis pomonella TaxID=28610 RepID=UPI00177E816B|nr:uncharacterized protein LOC118754219 [Rhagoletis pomonella]
MILVFHDKFSKWVEIVSLRKATTEGLSKSFRERILARFGVSKVLVTDNGAQFTSPYTPQENTTEKTNRNVKRIIAEIMLALNTSVCESIGYSPASLTQGREPRLPRAVYDETTFGTGLNSTTPNEKATTLKEYSFWCTKTNSGDQRNNRGTITYGGDNGDQP